MAVARTPPEVERALKRLTPAKFSQVCGEIGILEVTLPGATQAERATALVERTRGHSDYNALVRAINRIDPNAWQAIAPARAPILSTAVMGAAALFVILGLGGLMLILVLSNPAAAEPTATWTPTPPPTRTPVPTNTHTPPPTLTPSTTPTPSRTPRPTRDPSLPTLTPLPSPTASVPAPIVSIVYPQVEPQLPPAGARSYPSETVEFRWILRGVTLAPDERYYFRLYEDGQIANRVITRDPWLYYTVPAGANNTYRWTVTVVKVDPSGNILGAVSPESGPRTVVWQP